MKFIAKYLVLSLTVLLISCTTSDDTRQSVDLDHGKLTVSENNRFLQHADGTPFLYLGDTAWELFHKLDRDEADHYLQTRAQQRFTVIQAVVLAENDGLKTPNPYGHVPFVDLDPTQPNEAYFEHVDYIVNKANELGLVMGMLPTWGDKVFSRHPGVGPIVFDTENAEAYGRFLGERYKDADIIWILGGDRNPANDEVKDIWRAMAKGITAGDDGANLMTYHPRGATSTGDFFHAEDWLDFNMYQSGHSQHFQPVYRFAETEYNRKPAKPFVDGEPAYEDIPVKFWEYCDWQDSLPVPQEVLDENNLIRDKTYFQDGYFTDYDLRVHAYWNLLSGACGYTYGNNAVWQMMKKGGSIAIPCLTDWKDALQRPGAYDMQHVRTVLEKRPFWKLVPCQHMIVGENPKNEVHIRAACANDQSFALVYLAQGQSVTLNPDFEIVKAWWFDTRNGTASLIKNMQGNVFTPPTNGIGNDWLLVLDAATADIPGF